MGTNGNEGSRPFEFDFETDRAVGYEY